MSICGNDLLAIPELSEIPVEQLDWLCTHSSIVEIEPMGLLFDRGSAIDKMYIILEGTLELKIQRGNDFKSLDVLEKHSITGFLPYSRATTTLAIGQVLGNGRFLVFPKEHMRELTTQHYELTAALVQNMTSRTRRMTKTSLQDEKLMALGKLSAGLAHELNNPSSAMVSSAKELKNQLGLVPEKFKRVMSMQATADEIEMVNGLLFDVIKNPRPKLSLLEKNELEEDLEDLLEEYGVKKAFSMAEVLVDYSFSVEDVEKLKDGLRADAFPTTMEWIENVLTTEKLIDEISEAADRISSLVTSIKGYSHMDRSSAKEAMDIPKNINSTLTILNHKIKKKQINVELSIPNDFPQPIVKIGEINQVWTNILDNAIDAVSQKGIIKITGQRKGGVLEIKIKDNGTGISEENVSRVFEPFFTTKKIGEGTGLGLDVSYRIIKQHGGDIKVNSVKGSGTAFTVKLPHKNDS